MTYTKTILKTLLGATALTVFATGTAQAQNNFTPAGDTVSNTFTLDYNVGGIPQTQITPPASTDFTVDRLVDLTVASNGNNTNLLPGATDEELIFSVSNEGNDTQAYALTIFEETATTGDTIDTDDPASAVDTLVYYIDAGGPGAPGLVGDGVYTPGSEGTAIPYDAANPPTIAPDEVLWVVVTQDIPGMASDGDQADITLVADTLDPVAFTPVTADTGGNTLGGAAENVLADGNGTPRDADNDGAHSALATYIISAATITGDKVVSVHSQDGSTCTTISATPVAGSLGIPGSCVEYVISVVNSGSAIATDIKVTDTLPDELLFAAAEFGGDFTTGVGAFGSPVLPAENLDCISGACVINLEGASLPAPTGSATETTGTVTIRAYVK